MYGKLYVLLAILFVVTIASLNAEQTTNNGSINGKAGSSKKPDNTKENELAGDENEYPPLQSYFSNNQGLFNFLSRNQQPLGHMNHNPNSYYGFTCNRLLDAQYPIFSDMCGAVPQARYVLPNTFGHNDRWHLAHVLTSLMGLTTDPSCIRSLRHLLCPMLFQPCRGNNQPPLVLPCQYYCRAVKSQCGIPALDIIPCELLPYASDLCPSIPIAASPSAFFANKNQQHVTGPAPPQNPQTDRSYLATADKQVQGHANQNMYRPSTPEYPYGGKQTSILTVRPPTPTPTPIRTDY